MLSLARAGVAWFVSGGSLCGVVAFHWRAFLGGLDVDELGVGCFGIWMEVCVILR